VASTRSWLIAASSALLVWMGETKANDLATLTPETGPYMVLAGSSRGPEAEKTARELALELQKLQEFPVFLFREPNPKPGNPPGFAVFVGSFATTSAGFAARDRIKEIKPIRFESRLDQWRGVKRVSFTINPLIQDKSKFFCTYSPLRPVQPKGIDHSAAQVKARSTSCSAMSSGGP
jgi:hypothetical protein